MSRIMKSGVHTVSVVGLVSLLRVKQKYHIGQRSETH